MTPAQRSALSVALASMGKELREYAVSANAVKFTPNSVSESMRRQAERYQKVAQAMREIEGMLRQKEML